LSGGAGAGGAGAGPEVIVVVVVVGTGAGVVVLGGVDCLCMGFGLAQEGAAPAPVAAMLATIMHAPNSALPTLPALSAVRTVLLLCGAMGRRLAVPLGTSY
jgi:hypothetical protein